MLLVMALSSTTNGNSTGLHERKLTLHFIGTLGADDPVCARLNVIARQNFFF